MGRKVWREPVKEKRKRGGKTSECCIQAHVDPLNTASTWSQLYSSNTVSQTRCHYRAFRALGQKQSHSSGRDELRIKECESAEGQKGTGQR